MTAARPAPAAPASAAGTLLDGRVAYAQFLDGYRTGIEPVLLAASVPAVPGDRVVEGGTGAGAGLLCLAARVAGLRGVGLEIDPALATLAEGNVVANGHPAGPDGISIRAQDVATWRAEAAFDHAFANPPWHRPDGTRSPLPGRRLAKVAGGTLLAEWARALAAGLRRRGTLSLLLPAGALAQGLAALSSAGCPEIDVCPLWPRAGAEARLVIVRGVRLGGGTGRILPGLVLHDAAGAFTESADAVLRRGGAVMG